MVYQQLCQYYGRWTFDWEITVFKINIARNRTLFSEKITLRRNLGVQ
jgi:hypothetical protein